MAKAIIAEKLELLRRCLMRLQDKTPGIAADSFDVVLALGFVTPALADRMKRVWASGT